MVFASSTLSFNLSVTHLGADACAELRAGLPTSDPDLLFLVNLVLGLAVLAVDGDALARRPQLACVCR